MLSSLEGEEQARWPQKLPELVHAYNNFLSESTGLSPFFVMFGRHARLPVDVVMGARSAMGGTTSGRWVKAHHKALLWAYETVTKHAKQRQTRDQQRSSQRQRALPLLPGERVLIRNVRWRAQGKMAPRWIREPFVMVGALSPDSPAYQVRPEDREGPERTIHCNNLRPCLYPLAELPQEVEQTQDRPVVSGFPLMLPVRSQWMPAQEDPTEGQLVEQPQPTDPVEQGPGAAHSQEATAPPEQQSPQADFNDSLLKSAGGVA